MRGISVLQYAIKRGFKNLKKNSMFTIASIGTIAACLFLFGLFYFVLSNFQHTIHTVESSVGITAFFEEGITDEQIESIGKAIRGREEVVRLDFISAEEAWRRFKEDTFNGSEEDLASTFGEDNPLADSASYEIYLSDISKQEDLVTYVQSLAGVRKVNRSDTTAKSLASINSLVGLVSGAIIIILLAVSIFLIKTTISTGITVRSAEIGIMRLMGASDFFIRAPFVVEGILIGLMGAIPPLIILFLLYGRVISYILSKFASLSNILTFLSTGQVFAILIPISLLLGIGIGFLGSFFTVRKHLKV
ncbi:MAG: permease-like cell division protein FtsX, partial [Lachnospiraceae bacterium]|nr:permease-like cell division protein FtsX [Lachnospiraceae bacterium]